jgi:hypothetical protein
MKNILIVSAQESHCSWTDILTISWLYKDQEIPSSSAKNFPESIRKNKLTIYIYAEQVEQSLSKNNPNL